MSKSWPIKELGGSFEVVLQCFESSPFQRTQAVPYDITHKNLDNKKYFFQYPLQRKKPSQKHQVLPINQPHLHQRNIESIFVELQKIPKLRKVPHRISQQQF